MFKSTFLSLCFLATMQSAFAADSWSKYASSDCPGDDLPQDQWCLTETFGMN